MDTKPLESFAKAARRELIAAVSAQASAVLVPGSVARTERAETVRRLETEIAAHGHERVIDKVAYTWFNRLIALRFMDAKGYTAAGVVSPAHGQAHGQPEILADAKRGDIDADVVANAVTRGAILGLLDGTRRSTDAEGEAYALLLTEYCRYWHKAMPFMFEREGDYTELLVPAGLLADGGIVTRARNVLSEEVCEDVEVIGWLYQFYISERKDEVFAGFKKNKKAGADEIPAATQLFTPHWIVRYLVENSVGRLWMLNRPDSRLVDRMDYYIAPVGEVTDFLRLSGPEELTVIDPASGSGHMLTYAFDLLYAIYEEEGYAPSEIPGHILAHNLHGTEIDPRAGALAAFALTMKARAKDRRLFARAIAPKVCVIEPIRFRDDEIQVLTAEQGDDSTGEGIWNQFEHADIFGALIQPDAGQTMNVKTALEGMNAMDDILYAGAVGRARQLVQQAEMLSGRYAVLVANPPYMGSKNMDARLAEFAKKHYPNAKGDLMTMFMRRSDTLVAPHGWWGMINLPSWMSISTFADLRDWLLNSSTIDTMLHFGRGVFGSDFGSVGFVIQKSRASSDRRGIYRKLFKEHVEVRSNATIRAHFLDPDFQRFEIPQQELLRVPGTPIAYWLSDAIREAMAGPASFRTSYPPKKGNDTGDNARFLRQAWEVSRSGIAFGVNGADEATRSGNRWFPYNKGGAFRKWYGNFDLVVDWQDNGRRIRSRGTLRNQDYYFREGVTWTDVSSGSFAARYLPPGFLCDNSGSACYGGGSLFPSVLSFLCSSTAAEMLKVLNPTMHFQAGNIADLPLREINGDVVEEIVRNGVATARADWDSHETSWDFATSPLLDKAEASLAAAVHAFTVDAAAIAKEQQAREAKNNRIVAEAYGVGNEVPIEVPLHRVSLSRNVEFRYGPGRSAAEYAEIERADLICDFVSYAVGCMFGRYSIDAPGLILADQGSTFQDFLDKVPSSTFMPDADDVIPFVDDGWFEDDIVERFRRFLRDALGADHFEENLRFVEESLGVKTLRDYFITRAGKSKFYDDHVQRYKKRPIYWMFSSPKGSFNALIYLHRYTPSTVSTVLNEYLREYEAKLTVALQQAESSAVAGGSAKYQKEADRLRKVLAELRDYEHDVLYPLATQQIAIDLDDGVKANYPKFYPAVKRITGLEATDG
ncbi:BREX-1 system adenine-specific DNA-methyltransferase PglX [Microbacterium sp. WCS2018Hpa-9]|uniref:BREX-1 system adenine-specific DNA-methyltransferase PglX n=1 Tax=Microbacterium sp. WCS2018Hpa-9 TaxID=3073635 RepID=UPI002889AB6B|nr:BREX-1 system adenine-specific DNA-methyltransferase PglX [Microbacterium sp. WCS2018Hpa-9]